jgi:Bacterial protein of unknown function (DUF937)
MEASPLNLIDSIKRSIGDEFVEKMSSVLGETQDRTRSGIHASVPGILSGFRQAASTPDGAERLSSQIDAADEGALTNMSNVFGAGGSSAIERGSEMLSSILGGTGLLDLANKVSLSSGLPGKSVMTLLGALAPMVLGILKREQNTRGLGFAGLTRLLSGQPAAEEAYTAPRVTDRDVPTDTYGAPERRRSLSWVLPLIILAFLIGLIWHYASRPSSSSMPGAAVHAGTGPEIDQVRNQLGEDQQSALGILRSIQDPASAQAAVPKLKELNTRLDDTRETFDNLPADSKNTISSSIPGLMSQLKPEIERVLKIPGVTAWIGPELDAMLSKFFSFGE